MDSVSYTHLGVSPAEQCPHRIRPLDRSTDQLLPVFLLREPMRIRHAVLLYDIRLFFQRQLVTVHDQIGQKFTLYGAVSIHCHRQRDFLERIPQNFRLIRRNILTAHADLTQHRAIFPTDSPIEQIRDGLHAAFIGFRAAYLLIVGIPLCQQAGKRYSADCQLSSLLRRQFLPCPHTRRSRTAFFFRLRNGCGGFCRTFLFHRTRRRSVRPFGECFLLLHRDGRQRSLPLPFQQHGGRCACGDLFLSLIHI